LEAWRSGSAVTRCVRSTELTYAGPGIVLGWVTVCGQVNYFGV